MSILIIYTSAFGQENIGKPDRIEYCNCGVLNILPQDFKDHKEDSIYENRKIVFENTECFLNCWKEDKTSKEIILRDLGIFQSRTKYGKMEEFEYWVSTNQRLKIIFRKKRLESIESITN